MILSSCNGGLTWLNRDKALTDGEEVIQIFGGIRLRNTAIERSGQ